VFSDGTINSLVLGNTLYERLESEDCSSFVASPDFSLNASPASLSIVQGSSGASTIMINRVNGFNGSVNLSASGLPSGVTVGFAPNPATTTQHFDPYRQPLGGTGDINSDYHGRVGSAEPSNDHPTHCDSAPPDLPLR